MSSICIKNYSFKYAGEEKFALKNIDLTVNSGEVAVIFGLSGSGKTTLLKSIKSETMPQGEHSGHIESDAKQDGIGIVSGHYDMQLVTPDVLSNLVFQMENRGFSNAVMKKRLSETVNFFGISSILHEDAEKLSGGEKQLVSLCSAMIMHPKVLLLDEPLSQLDPVLQNTFLEFVKGINEDFSITIVITEHRLENVLTIADRLVFLENGEKVFDGAKEDVIKKLYGSKKIEYADFIPSIPRVSLAIDGKVLLTPKQFAGDYPSGRGKIPQERIETARRSEKDKKMLAEVKNVVFAYQAQGGGNFVLRRTSFKLFEGEIACLMGGNGGGKTTLLKIISGILKPSLGSVSLKAKKVCYMPQNIEAYFTADTVLQELNAAGGFDRYLDLSVGDRNNPKHHLDESYYRFLMEELKIGHLIYKHPFDISAGERQKVCLFSIMMQKPDLILLDEPTRGMDLSSKITLKKLLNQSGASVLISTHDLEFASFIRGRCLMLFDGDIAYEGDARDFFAGNKYYTTSINRAVKHIDERAIYCGDVLKLWEKKMPEFVRDY